MGVVAGGSSGMGASSGMYGGAEGWGRACMSGVITVGPHAVYGRGGAAKFLRHVGHFRVDWEWT
jgi:hypothetical protein